MYKLAFIFLKPCGGGSKLLFPYRVNFLQLLNFSSAAKPHDTNDKSPQILVKLGATYQENIVSNNCAKNYKGPWNCFMLKFFKNL